MDSRHKYVIAVLVVLAAGVLAWRFFIREVSPPSSVSPAPRSLTQEEIQRAEEGLTAPAGAEPVVPKKVLQSLSAPEPKTKNSQGADASVSRDVLDSLSAPK